MKITTLSIASLLILLVGIGCIVHALQDIFLATSMDEGVLDVTLSQIRTFSSEVMDKLTLLYQFNGLRLFATGLFFAVISLLPFRQGKKWAWYSILVIGGFSFIGQLVLLYAYNGILNSSFLPGGIFLAVLWGIGTALPAKKIFS